MRHILLREGSKELTYEIRGIVSKARKLQDLGMEILWENIGDPIQKHNSIPAWMKQIVQELAGNDISYGYCDSKGVPETRQFVAEKTNALGGVQITADDVLFFNGLGDAIQKLYQYLVPATRIIGPSPAYSTHSSAEAAHANHHPITYNLNPENSWYPDLDDLYNKVKYNPNIVGILIINPDNPTGVVYPRDILEGMLAIAREFDLFVIADEVYRNITYNGAQNVPLAEIIGEIPAISLQGLSKEIPWPGARCGWMEFYNRKKDEEFERLCITLENAKMIEVCSTTLPQLALPRIMSHPNYSSYREAQNKRIGRRAAIISDILREVPYITFNETFGAFYNTIIFKPNIINHSQELPVRNKKVKELVETWVSAPDIAPDKRFVYYLLASSGVCVVPCSSFASDLYGFRVTLLEEDEAVLKATFERIRDALLTYCAPVHV